MKNKLNLIISVGIGLLAGLIRTLEYAMTIGEEGYYLAVPAAPILKWTLIGLLALGILWCVIAYWGNKENTDAETLYGVDRIPRILFALMGLATGADGFIRMLRAGSALEAVGAVVFILGAFGWLAMARSPKRAGLLILLPTLQFGVQVIAYFWETYKGIHISAYILGMLGWCAALFFVHSLGKILAGAACNKTRLGIACGWILILLPAAILTLPIGTQIGLFNAEGLLLCILAGYTLKCLPREPQKPETVEGPDLSVLNEYMDAIPEVEEE